jgi:beta-1,4-mannosyltransferase
LVWLVGTLRGSKVIIDWHNLGYSILALKLGSDHIFVRLAKMSILPLLPYADHQTKTAIRFEARFGRVAYAHLFVTQAMHDFLVKEWKLQYETYVTPLLDGMLNGNERGHKAVLHDRPPAHFHPATTFETHEVTRLYPVILPFTFTSLALPSHFPIPACCLSAGVQSTDIHASYSSDVPCAPKSAV